MVLFFVITTPLVYLIYGLLIWTILRLILCYIRWRISPLRKCPGPVHNTSFLFGHARTTMKEPYLEPHKRWWKEEIHKHGIDNVPFLAYSSYFGQYTLLILDPDIIKLILSESSYVKEPLRFEKRYKLFINTVGEGLVTLEGNAWSRHRRIIQPSFQTSILKEGLRTVVPEKTTRLIQSWKISQGKDIDIFSHISALTLDILGEIAFSYNFKALNKLEMWASSNNNRDDYDENINNSNSNVAELDAVDDPIIQALTASFRFTLIGVLSFYLGIPWVEPYLDRNLHRTRMVLNNAVDDIIRDAREKINSQKIGNSNKRSSLLDLLFDANDNDSVSHSRKKLTDVELRDEAKTFIVAGHETTSTWIYWCLYALAKYPDIQEKIYASVFKSFPDKNQSVNLDEIDNNMEYFNAFMMEVLRLYSPVGTIIRFNTQEEHWNGYTIPENTRLILPFHLIHRHPKYWTEPEKFKVERWIGNDSEGEHRNNKFCFLPFSVGGRNCIGQRFAEIEAKLIVVSIIREFKIDFAHSFDDSKWTFKSFVTMKSNPPVRIVVKSRSD